MMNDAGFSSEDKQTNKLLNQSYIDMRRHAEPSRPAGPRCKDWINAVKERSTESLR